MKKPPLDMYKPNFVDPAKNKLTEKGLSNMRLFRALNSVKGAEGGYVGVKYIQGKR